MRRIGKLFPVIVASSVDLQFHALNCLWRKQSPQHSELSLKSSRFRDLEWNVFSSPWFPGLLFVALGEKDGKLETRTTLRPNNNSIFPLSHPWNTVMTMHISAYYMPDQVASETVMVLHKAPYEATTSTAESFACDFMSTRFLHRPETLMRTKCKGRKRFRKKKQFFKSYGWCRT